MMYSNFDRLFENLFNNYDSSNYRTYKLLGPEKESQCEVNIEKDGAYVSFEVPGYNKSNLKIELEGDNLVVVGEKEVRNNGKDSIKTISKQFKVGFDINPASIEATCEDGVLTVFIPNYKKQTESKKVIKIS